MEVAYANSARFVLAMPNATCDERVGRLFRLHASAGLPEGLSAMRLACRKARSPPRGRCLKKSAAVERAGGGG